MKLWLIDLVESLDGDDFNLKWQQAMVTYDMTVLREDTKEAILPLYPWEYHPDQDFVTNTIQELYYSMFMSNRIGKELNIDIYEWMKQAPFMCDRDVKLVSSFRKRLSDSIDDINDELE